MKVNQISPINRTSRYDQERHTMTIDQRIEKIKKIRDAYPDNHSQLSAINAQLERLKILKNKEKISNEK